MKNCKKTDEFLAELEKAGLSNSFEKICLVASKTIGCDLEDLIDDMVYQMENHTPELKSVWRAQFQNKSMAKEGRFMNATNPNAKTFDGRCDFPTAEAAKAALDKLIREYSKGARTISHFENGIGVDVVVNEKTASSMEIVHWRVVRRHVSKWEIVEEV